MSEAPPTSPGAALKARQQRILRRLGITASALMVIGVLTVLVLIVRTESAHDEERCRFEPVTQRSLAGAEVLEERRSCLPEVEERRYLVQRAGRPAYELARKRLAHAQFAPERYVWKLREEAPQQLVLEIEIDGKPFSEFHEQDRRP
ncbi:MAG TPA: hypothetical protein VFZ61_09475 [Polyangiales bacterium]